MVEFKQRLKKQQKGKEGKLLQEIPNPKRSMLRSPCDKHALDEKITRKAR